MWLDIWMIYVSCFVFCFSDMVTLRNAQDLDRSNRMKDLAKGIKDPEELQQHKRRENKKHVEQSVKERQKVSKTYWEFTHFLLENPL